MITPSVVIIVSHNVQCWTESTRHPSVGNDFMSFGQTLITNHWYSFSDHTQTNRSQLFFCCRSEVLDPSCFYIIWSTMHGTSKAILFQRTHRITMWQPRSWSCNLFCLFGRIDRLVYHILSWTPHVDTFLKQLKDRCSWCRKSFRVHALNIETTLKIDEAKCENIDGAVKLEIPNPRATQTSLAFCGEINRFDWAPGEQWRLFAETFAEEKGKQFEKKYSWTCVNINQFVK